jgi:hypothetical protein
MCCWAERSGDAEGEEARLGMDPPPSGVAVAGCNGIGSEPAMNIEISRQTRARLLAAARREGASVDELLTRLVESAPTAPQPATTELPLWQLCGTGPLYRRDIYRGAVSERRRAQAKGLRELTPHAAPIEGPSGCGVLFGSFPARVGSDLLT